MPSFRQFATQEEAEAYHLAANFDRSKWDNLLSGEERSGIYNYTSYWYSDMNTALRENYHDASVASYIAGATSGLDKFEAADDVVTYRGANLHWTANLLGGTEEQMSNAAFLKSRIGKTVVDRGFMSAGTHQDSSWTADVKYTIFVNKGVRGMYVDPISANRGEKEFLFNRDTEFTVHAIKTGSGGRIRELVLEALPTRKPHK